jgi:hypothetical protein
MGPNAEKHADRHYECGGENDDVASPIPSGR